MTKRVSKIEKLLECYMSMNKEIILNLCRIKFAILVFTFTNVGSVMQKCFYGHLNCPTRNTIRQTYEMYS